MPVATALTVYGIETQEAFASSVITDTPPVATALTVYGIETLDRSLSAFSNCFVATALTVYGIET